MGSAVLSYDSMVGSLKPLSGMDSSISWVNGDLLSISRLTYATPIVTRFSIGAMFACMSSHFLSISASSLCLISLSLRFTSPLPSSFWSCLLSSQISYFTSDLHLRSVVELSSSTSCAPSLYPNQVLEITYTDNTTLEGARG